MDDKTGTLTIQDAKMLNQTADVMKQFESAMSSYDIGDLSGAFNKLAPMIGNGAIKAGLAIRYGMVGFKIAIEGSFESSTSSSSVEGKYTLTLETYIHRDQVPKNAYDPVYQPVTEPNPVFAVDLGKVATTVVIGLLVSSMLPEVGGGAALVELFNVVKTIFAVA